MEYLLSKVADTFLSKLADYALGETETSVFKSLENHLKLLCGHASDIEEQIKKAELLGTKKRKKSIECWLEQVESIANEVGPLINEVQTRGFVKKFFSEGQAANLDGRVSELVEQCQVSGELVVDDHQVQGNELLTGKLVGEVFKKNLDRIWTLMVIEKVPCIGIHGMGGVGKTTLAKHINNRLVKESLYRAVWITMSQEYSVHMLQDEIANELRIDISNLRDVDKRSSALNKALSKIKNVVLIFDNVWERIDLMKLGHPLSVDGCRLVITTRKRQVCHQVGCREIIEVTTLQEDEAWILFREIHGPEWNLTPDVKRIARSTIQVCGGLPLGIITLAGSMRGVTTEHAWSDVLAQFEKSVMGQHDMDEGVFKVLKHSFDRLGPKDGNRNDYSQSQLCFLYCSTYPEDHEIDREELIRRFIVEEYLDRKSRKALFNEGHTILDKLVDACLLENGHHGGVKMHDLLRAMALEISKGKIKVLDGRKSSVKDVPNEELWTQDIEKIFLWNVQDELFPNIMTPDCPKLSTIVLSRSTLRWYPLCSLLALPDIFFSQMHCLSILDMSRSAIEILPNSLSHVVSLKALLFVGCGSLRHVPNLGKLKNLEELDLSCTGIEEAPQGMEELTNLKFLSFHGAESMKQTSLVLKFSKIQCLLLPRQMDLQEDEELVALEHLEEFGGWLRDVRCALKLISKPKLKCHIRVQPNPKNITGRLTFYQEESNELQVFVHKVEFEKASDDEDVVGLSSKANISHLLLERCKWQGKCIIDIVSRMSNPAYLKSLNVFNEESVEWVWRRHPSLASPSVSPPHAHQVFSRLKRLEISNCNKVKRLGLPPSQFPMLEAVEIRDCSEIEEIMEVDEEHGINNVVVFFPNLKDLCLRNLPRLKSICNATMVCPSIQGIELWGCKRLKKLHLIFGQRSDSPPPSNLRISLKKGSEEWWEALELGHPTHRPLLDHRSVIN